MSTMLREQLQRDEGCRLHVYEDSRGIPTIGYGRNLRDRGISQAEANMLLDHDITAVTGDVLGQIPCAARLDEVRRATLVNMAFNLGINGLLGFRQLLAAVEAEQWDAASAAMLDSKWARQVGVRAQRLARQMATGEWQ